MYYKLVVHLLFLHEFIMGSSLFNSAIFDNNNLVCILYCGQSVCYHNGGSALACLPPKIFLK